MVTYSAASFQTAYLSSLVYDSGSPGSTRMSNRELRDTIDGIQEHQMVGKSTPLAFVRALKKTKTLQESFWRNLVLWRCQDRKKRVLKEREMEKLTE